MIPHHLTFSTSRDALCPCCNGIITTGGWTIRGGLVLCLHCAKRVTPDDFHRLQSLVATDGRADFSQSHGVMFFTPPDHFPKTVVWALWLLSPANVGDSDSG